MGEKIPQRRNARARKDTPAAILLIASLFAQGNPIAC